MRVHRYPNRLRAERDALGLAQWEVGQHVGMSPDKYLRLEKGYTEPAFADVMRLARFFGVAPEALFEFDTSATEARAS